MIKAAFFDIDGTLLSFNTHRVSPGTIKAFDALHNRGILTFISTGRPRQIIPTMPIRFDGFITMNGSYVFLAPTAQSEPSEILFKQSIPVEYSDRFIRYADENGITIFIFMPDAIGINAPDPILKSLQAQLDLERPPILTPDQLLGKEVCQFIVIQPAAADAKILEMMPGCRLPRWHPAFSDLINGDNSKAMGMQVIMDRFGIAREETIAFGDGGNDIEMLDFAGIGVAMGNADDSVKAHADYVTTDVDNEGIYNALLHFGVIE